VQFVEPGRLLFVREGVLFSQTFNSRTLRLEGDATRIAENVPIVEPSARAGFSAAQNGVLVLGYENSSQEPELSWYDRAGKVLSRVGVAAYRGIDLSADGKRLVAHYHNDLSPSSTGDIWITDLERGTNTRFTFDGSQDNSSPIWSPDGTSVAFSSVRNNRFGLYRKASNGVGTEELLFESETRKVPMSWAHDGKSLVFVNYDPKTRADLWILPLTEDRQPRVYLQSPLNETLPQISPDGKWIAYALGAGGPAANQLWVQSYPTPGTKWQVSTNSANVSRWRADGKELFYLSGGFGEVWSVSVEHTGAGLTFGVPKMLFSGRWFSPPHQPSNTNFLTYAVSSDGQRFLFPRVPSAADVADEPQFLTVILNWPSLLKK
jgi:Tol biopolymer transport system component